MTDVEILDRVRFAVGRHDLEPADTPTLGRIVEHLRFAGVPLARLAVLLENGYTILRLADGRSIRVYRSALLGPVIVEFVSAAGGGTTTK